VGRPLELIVFEEDPVESATVTLHLADGTEQTELFRHGRGTPGRPMSDAELDSKVRELAAYGVTQVLAGAEPHLMVTDPPYGVGYEPSWRQRVSSGTSQSQCSRLTMTASATRALSGHRRTGRVTIADQG
jgi:hypothetical protein